jgi:ABC-type Fe3+-hydroxamate transport system substrate-binding protein
MNILIDFLFMGELLVSLRRPLGKENKMKKLVLLMAVAALALAACASATASANQNQSELDQNWQKWQDANISQYRYKLAISCFCIFSQDMPLIIEVQDGQVVSMEYSTGNEIDTNNREYFQRFETIDRLFEQLQKDIRGEADEVVVTYNGTYGFPEEVKIDYVLEATDDELWLTISDFEALQ